MVSRLDLLRLAESLDGECDFEDMTEEELEEIFGGLPQGAGVEEMRERYFSFHDDVKDRTLPYPRWSD